MKGTRKKAGVMGWRCGMVVWVEVWDGGVGGGVGWWCGWRCGMVVWVEVWCGVMGCSAYEKVSGLP